MIIHKIPFNMNSLHIKNYKNLEDLQISKLGRVNLIAGENNVGKSSLLEAISIHQSGGSLEWLKRLLEFRGEATDKYVENHLRKEMDSFLSFLPNYDDEHKLELPIILSDTKQNVEIRFVYYTETQVVENGYEGVIRTVIENYNPNSYNDNTGLGLEIATSFGQKILYTFNGAVPRLQTELLRKIQYVRMGDLNTINNPSLFDKLALTPLQKEVVKALQIIESGIADLNFLKDDRRRSRFTRERNENTDERVPYVVFEGESKPRRLSSMGDGINRILTIILAMLNAKDGVLLIDEFENGLHYSVQQKLWKVIFSLSASLNIQVFVTTHSRDAIRAFVAENTKNDGAFIRLERRKDKVVAVTYDNNEDLDLVLEQNIEIR